MNHIITIFLIFLFLTTQAVKKPNWWQQRHEREDIYYHHNKHEATMQEKGDTCLLCHTFAKTEITDPALMGKKRCF